MKRRRGLLKISVSCGGKRRAVFLAVLSEVIVVLIASLLMFGCGKETPPEQAEQSEKVVSEVTCGLVLTGRAWISNMVS